MAFTPDQVRQSIESSAANPDQLSTDLAKELTQDRSEQVAANLKLDEVYAQLEGLNPSARIAELARLAIGGIGEFAKGYSKRLEKSGEGRKKKKEQYQATVEKTRGRWEKMEEKMRLREVADRAVSRIMQDDEYFVGRDRGRFGRIKGWAERGRKWIEEKTIGFPEWRSRVNAKKEQQHLEGAAKYARLAEKLGVVSEEIRKLFKEMDADASRTASGNLNEAMTEEQRTGANVTQTEQMFGKSMSPAAEAIGEATRAAIKQMNPTDTLAQGQRAEQGISEQAQQVQNEY